jgi:hypothetical protein
MLQKIFKYQIYHLAAYLSLGAFLIRYSGADKGAAFAGFNAFEWVALSWIVAGLFQGWILLFWRLELYGGKIGKWFGGNGFMLFRVGFVLLGGLRFLSLIPIAYLSRDTLPLNPVLKLVLIAGTTPLILWGLYSVIVFFKINRAFGADHFFPEYRNMLLERRGIYKYISNSMYTVVLLVIYHPALLYESAPGLLAAFVHHLLVWVHFFCTERPDMEQIYAKRG